PTRDRVFGRGPVLEMRRHAQITIGQHADDASALVDNGHDAAIMLPHDLCGRVGAILNAAAVNGLCHQLSDTHIEILSRAVRKENGSRLSGEPSPTLSS